jgi:hypothetical protein
MSEDDAAFEMSESTERCVQHELMSCYGNAPTGTLNLEEFFNLGCVRYECLKKKIIDSLFLTSFLNFECL